MIASFTAAYRARRVDAALRQLADEVMRHHADRMRRDGVADDVRAYIQYEQQLWFQSAHAELCAEVLREWDKAFPSRQP